MEIIKTKTVFLKTLDLEDPNSEEVQDNIDKTHDDLLKHGSGGWFLLSTEDKNTLECVLKPSGKDIDEAGYNWKEYQLFEANFYKDRLIGILPVGFRYVS